MTLRQTFQTVYYYKMSYAERNYLLTRSIENAFKVHVIEYVYLFNEC